MEQKVSEMVRLLYSKDAKVGRNAMNQLLEISSTSDAIYQFFDDFATMTEDTNSYVRTRGLLLIASCAKWDQDNKIDQCIEQLLKHITDEKPITSRQFIKALPEIASYKPELVDDIKDALRWADTEIYADSMQPLVYKDIRTALQKIK